MTPAERVVRCKGWRWMPGMAGRNADGPFRVEAVDDDGAPCIIGRQRHRYTDEVVLLEVRCGPIPDLSDPATVGCLLALVREAWGEARVTTTIGGQWRVSSWDGLAWLFDGATEAEALVAALEEAP